jgi:FtsP/CotA-like multicopper oxidase with cupredoxin domain
MTQMPPASNQTSQVFDPLQADFSKLKDVSEPEIVDLTKVDVYELKATVVKQTVAGKVFRRFAYNGSIPGPLFKVKQGQTAKIRFVNETDVETSIHSHGLRHSWKMDGQVPTSQPAVKPGESFLYELKFPDAGVFWYHPHIREDYQQDMGLMGNFWVEPEVPTHWNEVSREDVLMVDDMLAKAPVAYPFDSANHAIMGRFGDTMLVNGKESLKKEYRPGEVVRYFVTNAANTRTFRLKFSGAKMKLVGSDLSQFENEIYVDHVTIAPGERYIIEVQFPKNGNVTLENATPVGSTRLVEFLAKGDPETRFKSSDIEKLRRNVKVTAELKKALEESRKEKTFSLKLDVAMASMQGMDHSKMGHDMMDHSKMDHSAMGHRPKEKLTKGRDVPWVPTAEKVEWEDEMAAMNAASDTNMVKWKMTDQDKKENMQANWILKKGSSYRVILENPKTGAHPMQHPIHFHGQRFFVDKVNGKKVKNRAWKDTVLVGLGDKVEIVLEASNPGKWMAHCHIAEHLTSGMMTGFEVTE